MTWLKSVDSNSSQYRHKRNRVLLLFCWLALVRRYVPVIKRPYANRFILVHHYIHMNMHESYTYEKFNVEIFVTAANIRYMSLAKNTFVVIVRKWWFLGSGIYWTSFKWKRNKLIINPMLLSDIWIPIFNNMHNMICITGVFKSLLGLTRIWRH